MYGQSLLFSVLSFYDYLKSVKLSMLCFEFWSSLVSVWDLLLVEKLHRLRTIALFEGRLKNVKIQDGLNSKYCSDMGAILRRGCLYVRINF